MLLSVDWSLSPQIALRREKMGEDAPFWRFSAASYPDLEEKIPSVGILNNKSQPIANEASNDSRVYNVLKTTFCL